MTRFHPSQYYKALKKEMSEWIQNELNLVLIINHPFIVFLRNTSEAYLEPNGTSTMELVNEIS